MPDIENVPDDALFGKYELGKLLGCGAFAKVYHARNIQMGESVAIKIINKKKIADSGLISNMKREITIMRNLQHSNIVKPYEVLATKSKIFIVMEYVKGGELFAKISKRRFREDLSRKYFHQLISAVGYCHLRGVYHRDLKPENLLLDEDGNLKVSDFGLSAMKEQIGQDGLLYTLCGTPAYVAPEVLCKKGYDGAKIDVWSCGVILFLLNAGYLPFNDPNLMLMYKKIHKGEFRCPKWFSADLKGFMSRLMDTNPRTRITVEEIVKHPWFTKGGMDTNFHLEFDDMYVHKADDASETSSRSSSINAFDLISFSSGLDLSALFEDSCNAVDQREERLMLSEPPEKILETMEEFAKGESLKVRKFKEWGLEIQGQNRTFSVWVEVYQLTDNLAVVEARIRGSDAMFMEFWDNKLKPLHIASAPQK